ncbi:[FeFe] hydrogenase H-cluster radical SAM maturase HydE [Pleomorphomonas carboxyditropha]|uniref:[FeFe] hydrogenase H-cluster radical SAM maturase HydE n=1 Tax=Pleomorphomonas carboxyditropha TaxID=2023338 RepID=A0A2G9WY53_9HYPH|nr:[FeFe] hydrogenase H-cluster radical SAM maturase HydE [Pleomorphomonas carboxyditropha]PIO99637.1 [FeFe] hydrogenase H-cluster radical SAM maturase HydE [Pleomorphomonas carboxyditropha]
MSRAAALLEQVPTGDVFDRAAVRALFDLPRETLFARADAVRKDNMGDDVFLRGIVEFSNICANDCLYCGIRKSNHDVRRYRIDEEEILEVARRMEGWQQTTIVLQSGEVAADKEDERIERIIRRIKTETRLAVTMSAGNRPRDTYARWRAAGMDRYLLRFETSDPELFAFLHPDCDLEERIRCLQDLRSLGVQVGSGFMIGVPGETLDILADNILLCRDLDLDMIGIGPFIAHPDTPLVGQPNAYAGDSDMFFAAVSALRIVNPRAHIPATTAFDAIFPHAGRDLVLQRGANVFMPNATPGRFRKNYMLYPDKPCVDEDDHQCSGCAAARIWSIGRVIGQGPGHSIKVR